MLQIMSCMNMAPLHAFDDSLNGKIVVKNANKGSNSKP